MGAAPGNNSANFNNCAIWDGLTGNVTTVGSNGGPSYYGTYDQGGNIKEYIVDSSLFFLAGAGFDSTGVWGIGNNGGSYIGSGFRLASSSNPLNLLFFVDIGDANNTGDIYNNGSVAYTYKIAKYPVTNYEYTEFLNAVAKVDTYFLYNTNMAGIRGGIIRSGSVNNFTYTVKNNYGNKPVIYLSWFSAARYCNWLHNGKETGSTETGAYTMSGAQENTNYAVAKNVNAKYWIPTIDEWYKAGYYKGNGTNSGFWNFATQYDSEIPTCVSADSTGEGPFSTAYFYYNTACNPTDVLACVTSNFVVPGQTSAKIGYLNWTLPTNIDCSQFIGTFVRVYYSNMYPNLGGWAWVPFPDHSCPINVFAGNTQKYEIRLQNTLDTNSSIYSSWVESNIISYDDSNSLCIQNLTSQTPTSTLTLTPTPTKTPTQTPSATATPTITPTTTQSASPSSKVCLYSQVTSLIDKTSSNAILFVKTNDNPQAIRLGQTQSTPTPTATPSSSKPSRLYLYSFMTTPTLDNASDKTISLIKSRDNPQVIPINR